MNEFTFDSFLKKYNIFHRLTYIFVIFTAFVDRFVTKSINNTLLICTIVLMAFFLFFDILVDIILNIENSNTKNIIKLIELISCLVVQFFLDFNYTLLYSMTIIYIIYCIEFIILNSENENGSIGTKRMVVLILSIINMCISYINKGDTVWIGYALVQVLVLILIFFVVEYIYRQNESYMSVITSQRHEISNYESATNELLEYQQRIKETNELINYQKIDLTRAYNHLEQINIETNSQTEMMKYMSSTFDIQKCLNLMVDTISSVKAPKICAMYLTSGVFNNEDSTLVAKTVYSSVQRRLKKEINNIYKEFEDEHKGNIITDAACLDYKFLEDTNISKISILPIRNNKQLLGLMVIGSDDDKFFESGLSYYENCVLELVVSIKSTNMYLKMQDMARKDGLTGIYNRLYFNELYAKTIKNVKQKSQHLSVALYDIDKFKNVNDTYGHLAGDMVIKMVAGVGQKYAEKYNGIACRYGGEEFLLVLPKKDQNEALEILNDLHKEIQDTIVSYNNTVITVNVCIGLSSYPELCDNPEQLVGRADKAMYYGKKNGRGRLVVDNPDIDN